MARLQDVRQLVVELRPKALDDFGLAPALERLATPFRQTGFKHAQASRVSIVLTRKDAAVIAVIEDDGRGFDAESTCEAGFGPLGMRERVELLGGRFQVEGGKEGAAVIDEVPIA